MCQSFTPLTNTIFDSHKIPISEWFEFLLSLFEFHSIKTSSYDNRNVESTGRYWLLKVFEVLKGLQDEEILDVTIYLNEMYLPKIKGKTIKKYGKKLRSISNNKIGIGVAINKEKSIFIVTWTSKPSFTSTLRTCTNMFFKRDEYIITLTGDEYDLIIKCLIDLRNNLIS